ncbi:hypothetical protein GEMRC1_007671 [Eukaryota sp. GEM-RC1]
MWETLNLANKTCDIIHESFGFDEPVGIQKTVIPRVLNSEDVVVVSPTGSGKTLCFLLPIHTFFANSTLVPQTSPTVLIILPTQELALQVFSVAEKLFPPTSLSFVSRHRRIGSVPSSDIVIGTPGSLYNPTVTPHFCRVQYLILDEVDRLLDITGGQIMETTKKIMATLPKHRRTLFFSATIDPEFRDYWVKISSMRNPVVVDATSSNDNRGYVIPASLVNEIWITKEEDKLSILYDLFKNFTHNRIIVFFATRAMVDFFELIFPSIFASVAISSFFLHGKMSSSKRKRTLDNFRSSPTSCVLFATDVAARGLDISGVDLVLQFDAPTDPSSFVHRAGRTARMGQKEGVSS